MSYFDCTEERIVVSLMSDCFGRSKEEPEKNCGYGYSGKLVIHGYLEANLELDRASTLFAWTLILIVSSLSSWGAKAIVFQLPALPALPQRLEGTHLLLEYRIN